MYSLYFPAKILNSIRLITFLKLGQNQVLPKSSSAGMGKMQNRVCELSKNDEAGWSL